MISNEDESGGGKGFEYGHLERDQFVMDGDAKLNFANRANLVLLGLDRRKWQLWAKLKEFLQKNHNLRRIGIFILAIFIILVFSVLLQLGSQIANKYKGNVALNPIIAKRVKITWDYKIL